MEKNIVQPTTLRHARYLPGAVLLSLALMTPGLASAHGFAGKRFFPATLTFDDPFAADEFDLLYNHMNDVAGEDQSVNIDSVGVEYAKTITPTIALSVGTEYDWLKFADGTSKYIAVSVKVGDATMPLRDGETYLPLWRTGGPALRGFALRYHGISCATCSGDGDPDQLRLQDQDRLRDGSCLIE